ncbi:MAG: hypothetical protein AAF340_07835 [Pseudomonadota bacterium]
MLKTLSLLCAIAALSVAFWPTPKPDKRILFIGNSLTYGNHLPEQVRRIAASSTPPVTYEVVTVARAATVLLAHIQETNAVETIQQGNWDVVVLQDGSSAAFDDGFRHYTERAMPIMTREAHKIGATIIYYAHWPPGGKFADIPEDIAIDKIEGLYAKASQDFGGKVARSGKIWVQAHQNGISGLYDEDGHHATLKGAYSAALGIVAALGDADPTTSSWAPRDYPQWELDFLRATASKLPPIVRSKSQQIMPRKTNLPQISN